MRLISDVCNVCMYVCGAGNSIREKIFTVVRTVIHIVVQCVQSCIEIYSLLQCCTLLYSDVHFTVLYSDNSVL